MYYVSKAPNGSAMISTKPIPGTQYIEVETLPEGDGRLMLGRNNKLFRIPFETLPETDGSVNEEDMTEEVTSDGS